VAGELDLAEGALPEGLDQLVVAERAGHSLLMFE
jgi:hypothetical protein